jgi:hypothetical protein
MCLFFIFLTPYKYVKIWGLTHPYKTDVPLLYKIWGLTHPYKTDVPLLYKFFINSDQASYLTDVGLNPPLKDKPT